MAAFSVTGTGPGESGGLQKHHLHSGCGCCGQSSSSPSSESKRNSSCVVRAVSRSQIVRGSFAAGLVRSNSCF